MMNSKSHAHIEGKRKCALAMVGYQLSSPKRLEMYFYFEPQGLSDCNERLPTLNPYIRLYRVIIWGLIFYSLTYREAQIKNTFPGRLQEASIAEPLLMQPYLFDGCGQVRSLHFFRAGFIYY